MSERIECAGLSIDAALHALVTDEIAPGTGVTAEQFWQGVYETNGLVQEILLYLGHSQLVDLKWFLI